MSRKNPDNTPGPSRDRGRGNRHGGDHIADKMYNSKNGSARRIGRINRKSKRNAVMEDSLIDEVARLRAQIDVMSAEKLAVKINSPKQLTPMSPVKAEPTLVYKTDITDGDCILDVSDNEHLTFSYMRSVSLRFKIVILILVMTLIILSNLAIFLLPVSAAMLVGYDVGMLIFALLFVRNLIMIKEQSFDGIEFNNNTSDLRADAMSLEDLKHTQAKYATVTFRTYIGVALWSWEFPLNPFKMFLFKVLHDTKEVVSVELFFQTLIPRNILRGDEEKTVMKNIENTVQKCMTVNVDKKEVLASRCSARATASLAFAWFMHLEQRQEQLPFPHDPHGL